MMHRRIFPWLAFGSLLAILIVVWVGSLLNASAGKVDFGVTFSTVYAHGLGLDVEKTYAAMLEELGVRRVRLPLYWSQIEKQPGVYDWAEADRLIEMSEKAGVKLTLAIGAKVPRWPECHTPGWLAIYEAPQIEYRLFQYLENVVTRYEDVSAIERWQVENEPTLDYGNCPPPDIGRLIREVSLVRSLDARPIQLTASGELDAWVDLAVHADVLGVSLYRKTWHAWLGHIYYPLSPLSYRLRKAQILPLVDRAVISELQAEPWFYAPIDSKTPQEWYKEFDEDRLRKNVAFAQRTGFEEAYLWGVEWWYFLKTKGEDRLWESARAIEF